MADGGGKTGLTEEKTTASNRYQIRMRHAGYLCPAQFPRPFGHPFGKIRLLEGGESGPGLVRVNFSTRRRIMQKAKRWIGRLAVSVFLGVPAKADNSAAEATYKAKCALCHGPDGKGETATGKTMKVKDFTSAEVQKTSDADLTDAISKGRGKMPAYKTLTPEQVKGLLGYIRSFAKKS